MKVDEKGLFTGFLDGLITTITTNFDTHKEEQHDYATIANAMTRIFGMERVKWVLDTPLVNVEDSKLRLPLTKLKLP